MTDSGTPDGIGGKVAGRVADYLARSYLNTKERGAGLGVRLAMATQEEFFRLTGSELKAAVGPLWAQLADSPDVPDWARNTGHLLSRGHGQWQTMLGTVASGVAFGGGILDLVNNEIGPFVQGVIAANPNKRLSPEQAAAVKVHGLNWGADLEFEAAMGGINRERFIALQGLSTVVLAPAEIVELYRRGELDRPAALRFLARVGMDGDHAGRLLTLSRSYITLPDAGAMWNRSVITTDELRQIARLGGYTDQDADRYAELGGEPPAPELLYTAYRRGVIDQARLKRGIVQGPIRTEWFDVLDAMQYRPMSPEQAASAVTQGHMTIDRGRAIAKEYGLEPDDFETIVEVSGRPPGVDFASEAYLRGFITDDQWASMFLESAIKNRYLDVLRKMRTRLIPQETARSLLAKGVITQERCAQILTQHGFEPDDVAALIAGSTSERSQATRDLSLATVRTLYAEQEITAQAATDMLLALGYDDNEAAWELALADLARVRTYRNAVITRIRAGYVKGLLSDQDASNAMDGLNVPPERRNTLLSIWQIERTTVTRDLTPAQIIAGAKKNLIDVATAVDRLIGQGYAQDDALILLASAGINIG